MSKRKPVDPERLIRRYQHKCVECGHYKTEHDIEDHGWEGCSHLEPNHSEWTGQQFCGCQNYIAPTPSADIALRIEDFYSKREKLKVIDIIEPIVELDILCQDEKRRIFVAFFLRDETGYLSSCLLYSWN